MKGDRKRKARGFKLGHQNYNTHEKWTNSTDYNLSYSRDTKDVQDQVENSGTGVDPTAKPSKDVGHSLRPRPAPPTLVDTLAESTDER